MPEPTPRNTTVAELPSTATEPTSSTEHLSLTVTVSCNIIYKLPKKPLINPRRSCTARVTVLGLCVCVSVCLFVYDYSRTIHAGYEAAYERYQWLQCYKGMKNNVAETTENKRKSQYT